MILLYIIGYIFIGGILTGITIMSNSTIPETDKGEMGCAVIVGWPILLPIFIGSIIGIYVKELIKQNGNDKDNK